MNSKQINRFLPDYLVTPGEVLEEYLEDLGMTQTELADRTGLANKTINEIIKAKSSITPETALKLERALGRPAHFWSNLERQYQDDRTRLAEKERMASYLEWLKRVPVAAMAKLGWIPKLNDRYEQLDAILRFFSVASPAQWKTVWSEYQVAYRQTARFEACAEAVSAWLRQGEVQAQQIKCAPFDRRKFMSILDAIRDLTREAPDVFVPRLEELCSSAGVAVVFLPELPKTGVYGATRWLNDKAVIQLSLRYKSNDHLWFTFFHEAGHILKHGRKDVYIEGKGLDGEKEEEANAFARDKLIPPAQLRRLLEGGRPTLAAIERFAEGIGIAPGIVVGRLQHENVLPMNTGNKLKIFYCWKRTDAE
ncbi:MAG: HigA family addiction module antitoxin [Verrucomicrobiota bacterium]|jgi:HTH-type transcriptional regulator/antitoxin HigA